MAAEVRMVLYEDDSVQVQYVDGSTLQLSPCGSEFLFEKAPPLSAHPLEQPERIRQRTQFVISTYREQLQRALDFRNSFATYPFLSESIIPSERKKRLFTDVPEVRWPSLGSKEAVMCLEGGSVTVSSLDGHAFLCLPEAQPEFTVYFLCNVSQKPDSSVVWSEQCQAKRGQLVGKNNPNCTFGSSSGQNLKNKEKCCVMKSKGPSEKSCVNGMEGREELPLPGTEHMHTHTWVQQRWSVASCPKEWKYPLSLALKFRNQTSELPKGDADAAQDGVLTSGVSEEEGEAVSVLPRALPLSCPVPHLHRWNFCDSYLQRQFDEEYSYPELVKVVWHKGITYRLTHKKMNSIEIYPGDGSLFKSEGAYFGKYFTYYPIQKGSEERVEKMYSVSNLPPDRPGGPFSVSSLLKQATRILQHCANIRLSLSHNYHICCWKMVPWINDSNILPCLLRDSFIPSTGRFLAYSDEKVHAMFFDGITLTLNWDFSFLSEERQVNQSVNLAWCKLTFPDGQDKLIQIEHPGPYERYVTTVISWCRKLTHVSQREMPTQPASSVLEENWSVASELEKIQKFNSLLENSGVLNPMSKKKTQESSDHFRLNSSESLLGEEINENKVLVALKRTSEILEDIDCLLSKSKK
ncbi:uncharacterized protein C5orf34 homolog isoform X2 [Tenrec ecaudatus]